MKYTAKSTVHVFFTLIFISLVTNIFIFSCSQTYTPNPANANHVTADDRNATAASQPNQSNSIPGQADEFADSPVMANETINHDFNTNLVYGDTTTHTNHQNPTPLPNPPPSIADVVPPQPLAAENLDDHTNLITAHIRLANLRTHRGGDACIAVYDNSSTFLTDHHVVSHCIALNQLDNDTLTIQLDGPGLYAVSVLHDEDRNDRLTSGFFGIPKEGFGFSNNPKIIAGPPTFEVASTWIRQTKDIVIKMKYFL